MFDLGGVIITVDPWKVVSAIAHMAKKDIASMRIAEREKQLFMDYERGDFDDNQFRQLMREVLEVELSNDQIDTAWNAMLLDIPVERIRLQELRKEYKLFALSNTNAIHLQAINTILHQNTGIAALDQLFDKTYYSYQIKKASLRQPVFSTYCRIVRYSLKKRFSSMIV